MYFMNFKNFDLSNNLLVGEGKKLYKLVKKI